MNIIIVGGSETGYFLAFALSNEEENRITLIDRNPATVQKVQNNLNVAALEGDATDPNTLLAANINHCDAIIACTNDDAINITCCFIASNFNVPRRAAVNKFISYKETYFLQNETEQKKTELLNIAYLITEEIIQSWGISSLVKELNLFADGRVMMVGVNIEENSPLLDKRLYELDRNKKFLVGCIVRNSGAFIPDGDSQIMLNDTLYILFSSDQLHEMDQSLKLNLNVASKGKILLTGDPEFLIPIAQGLAKKKFKVDVVSNSDGDLEKMLQVVGDDVNIKFSKGDLKIPKTQVKLGVENSEALISVFRNDNYNIHNCLIAKSLNCQKTIALINRQDLIDISENMGVDSYFSPRLLVLRGVKKLFKDMDYDFDFTTVADTPMEVITLIARAESEVVGKQLKEIKFPKNTLIAMIIKNQKNAVLASGNSIINSEDRLIIFSMPEMLEKLMDMFDKAT